MRTACTYNTCAGAPHVRMGFIETCAGAPHVRMGFIEILFLSVSVFYVMFLVLSH